MKELDELLKVVDRLLGPGGCPWDHEQTMKSARTYVLEEVSELIEAIDLEDNHHIQEELGDLFYNAIFLSRLAEKEGRCQLVDAVKGITEKLIRRHPHVFEGVEVKSTEEIVHRWEQIKKQEKGNLHRKSVLDGIPKNLPALARAKKMINRIKKTSYSELPHTDVAFDFSDEDTLGTLLWQITTTAHERGLDAEHALRKVIAEQEKAFREFEISIEGGNNED
ncbi:MAG: Nucleoside triphosphate pyrophosphohydrolase [Chlamydiae bacterium]|nr:Nucleoside triphosphate pyrophosphohydrolase [Chlamydiota bacterium]